MNEYDAGNYDEVHEMYVAAEQALVEDNMKHVTAATAFDHMKGGGIVFVAFGDPDNPEDPKGHAYIADETVWSVMTNGWSAGIKEAVCAQDSDFLITWLGGAAQLELGPDAAEVF